MSGASAIQAAFGNCYSGQSVVITGNTGFKGGWLSLWLLSLGADVHGYSLEAPTDPSLFEMARLREVVHHTHGDVRDVERIRSVLHSARPRFIFHLAAQPIVSLSYTDPLETISTNAMGTVALLEALRSVTWPCAAVMITSDKVYDNVEWPWGYRETDALGGKDVYSGSKGMAELAIHSYFHSFFSKQHDHPLRLGVARAGNVIGGGDFAADRIVPDCVRAWSDDNSVILRSPTATRPWQHVMEPLSGYLALGQELAERDTHHGGAFNFGPRSERSRTVVELLEDLARLWGVGAEQEAYRIVGQVPFRESGQLRLNSDKALLALRWNAALDYRECVGMTGDWYRAVMREKADARGMTLAQIAHYEALATERGLEWCLGRSAQTGASTALVEAAPARHR